MTKSIYRAAVVLALSAMAAGCAAPRQAVAPSAPAPAIAAAASAPAVAPLDFTSRTLANGLRVYAIQDRSSPNVSVQVWYDVGSKDDPRGRSGFAHLFEHLMFKSTRNLVPEQFDRLTEDVGGFNNASTTDDYTNYYEVVPANHLEQLLWAEAERMGSLVVEPGFFASERDVVKEEFRSRVLAQPYGKMYYVYYPEISYSRHPYARPGIGSIEDLDAATIDDVRAFHATYYRPDNAILVVAGNFDQAELDRWVDRYFAPLTRPSFPIPRVTVQEPDRQAAAHYTVYEANTPLPATLISYPAPPAAGKDSAAIAMLNAILASGESSRLHQALVYRDQIASQVGTFPDVKQGRGNIVLFAILAGGKSAADGEAALRREVARLRDEPVTDAELAEARNELLTAALQERETVDGKASALAGAVILEGDPRAADRNLAEIAALTAADVQRAAQTWLRDDRSASLRYLPEEMKAGGPAGDAINVPATVEAAALVKPAGIRIVEAAPAAERIAPPPIGPELKVAVPQPVTQRLANGLTVISVERRDLPLLTASLAVGAGSAAVPDGKAGLAELAADTITQGTRTRSATEIARAIEALGSSLGGDADWDGSSLSLTVKSDQADAALAIMADVARHPAFAAEEVERQRAIMIDALAVAMRDPSSLADAAAARTLYGDTPYGQVPTPDGTVKAITRDDIAAFYAAHWMPGNATLILAGDVDAASARLLAERHFGSWSGTAAAAAIPPPPAPPAKPIVVVIEMPDAGQAAVAVTRAAIPRHDPLYYQAIVANAVLGTGYSSRLNQEIRIKRGLSYGAGSSIEGRRGTGPFTAQTQTKNASAAEVLELILAEMRRLGDAPIPAAELATRKAVLTGNFGRSIETTSGLAGAVAGYVMDGVGPDELDRFMPAVNAVTPQQAGSAAARVMGPAAASVVIVGDARQFLPALRRNHREIVVIPLAKLNLNSPSLR